jgi:cytochrome c peroxidase
MRKVALIISSVLYLLGSELILPIPQTIAFDPGKAALGKKLFFDPILSKDKTVSCFSCHNIYQGGDDGLSSSIGIKNQKGSINAPTVLNAHFNFVQFWDGRSKDLVDQALQPIENPIEMGHSLDELMNVLQQDSEYRASFQKLYKDGVTKANLAHAIAEFEKTLITPDSRFDQYLRGNTEILTQDEIEGYELFRSKGCISCHHGINIGGNLYAKIGIFEHFKSESLGRFAITKKEKDKFYFKVPSLRNIALTDPYFHDGSQKTLKDAIQKMSYYQLGREISPEEVDKIYKFLHTLTGKLPELEGAQ